MRKTWLALLALPLTTTVTLAQPPADRTPRAPAAKSDAALDRYLLRWEDAMRNVKTLALSCTRTETDKVYKTKRVFKGGIWFKKPSYFLLAMKPKDKPENFERIVSTGEYIYQFVPQQKEIRTYKGLKPGKDGRIADDTSLAFLFGMKAEEAKKRYDLKLAKEDKHYVYIDVLPRRDVDKADFQQARIVLNKDTFLPRLIWFLQPNKNQVQWDIPAIKSNVEIRKDTFAPPKTPKGWKMVRGQAPRSPASDKQPRVVRPNKQ